MKLTTCKCVWCDATYQTSQPQRRRFCGNGNCYKQFHKSRQKEFFLTNKEMFRLIDEWMNLTPPQHPNAQHPVMLADKVLADMYNAATELVKAENLLIAVAAEAGNKPEKSLADIINEVKSKQ